MFESEEESAMAMFNATDNFRRRGPSTICTGAFSSYARASSVSAGATGESPSATIAVTSISVTFTLCTSRRPSPAETTRAWQPPVPWQMSTLAASAKASGEMSLPGMMRKRENWRAVTAVDHHESVRTAAKMAWLSMTIVWPAPMRSAPNTASMLRTTEAGGGFDDGVGDGGGNDGEDGGDGDVINVGGNGVLGDGGVSGWISAGSDGTGDGGELGGGEADDEPGGDSGGYGGSAGIRGLPGRGGMAGVAGADGDGDGLDGTAGGGGGKKSKGGLGGEGEGRSGEGGGATHGGGGEGSGMGGHGAGEGGGGYGSGRGGAGVGVGGGGM